MNMQKLSKTAKGLGVFFKVLQRILLISFIVLLCVLIPLTIYNAVNPDAVIGTGLNELDLDHITIVLAEEYAPTNGQILRYVWIMCAFFPVYLILGWLGCSYLRKILSPMEEGKPFHPDVARYLKKLAIVDLVLGIVMSVGKTVNNAVGIRTFGLDRLPETDMIRSIIVNNTLSIPLVSFFVLLLMSWIFSYGAQLQQLSDETL